ncbi:class IIb bacteriocin, lactobin A/cerein 7B family [Pelagibacterium lacus]|uniref:Class IIb bacteriocin, lactobin A/cerein 7B family n=1 Tax=Pelagibacterium lacus TaxID=2282655 RepID=A0A369W181_9HYPH|nr:class IIb bacteriocin, lactobin A/cerein 7B family [Pelagibacterium lacus]RDE07645.1 class IIb bacteriocin, lactobin A/cerein 7B family [Pelagibacterium lacus]
MRELKTNEIEDVSGGVGPGGAVLGAVIGGVGAAVSGGNAGQIAGAALLGGVGGFFGAIALGGYGGAVTGMFGAKAVAVGAATSLMTR